VAAVIILAMALTFSLSRRLLNILRFRFPGPVRLDAKRWGVASVPELVRSRWRYSARVCDPPSTNINGSFRDIASWTDNSAPPIYRHIGHEWHEVLLCGCGKSIRPGTRSDSAPASTTTCCGGQLACWLVSS